MEYRIITASSELQHHGILGQKWGVRRFQNPDGSLTPAGEKRYNMGITKGIDKGKYYAYDKKANPNKYYRLTEDQKKSNDFKKAVNIEKALDEEATRFESTANQKEWKKYAKEYAAERYDNRIKQDDNIEESKEQFIDRWVKDARGSGDMSLHVWEYYSEHNPKTKKLNDQLNDWIQTTIKKEAANGINLSYGNIYDQIMEAYFNDESVRHSDDEDPNKYGIPSLKKYPMPDAKHVRSAIKFFNYVTPAHEKELANAILNRMHEYDLTFEDISVGEDNRFSKYMPKDDELEHHGILGQKWGIRRFQNADGSLTPAGKARYASGADFDGDAVSVKGNLSGKYRGKKKYYKANKESAADFDGDDIKKSKWGFEPSERRAEILAKRKARQEAREAKRQAAREKREAERKEQKEREQMRAEYDRLAKMDPKYLTDQELQKLNNRKQAEDNFNRNYHPESAVAKKGKEYVSQAADALIRQVVIPSIVATGKAKVHDYVKKAVKSGDLPEVYADIIAKEFANGGKGKKSGSPDGKGKKKTFTKKK